jgi:hypothetical protein
MIAKGLYSYSAGGEFIPRIFRNIVHTALMVRQYKWLESFLSVYLQKIPEDSRNNMGNMAKAMMFFEKREYEKSLSIISKIDYEIFHFKIDIKNLQMKIYYELGYFEELLSAIDSYRHFIANNKFISERYKAICTEFVNNVSRMLRIKNEGKAGENTLLRKDIISSPGALNQVWLLEKTDELD